MADMHSSDLAKAEVTINNDANSGKAVELPRHNYFTANGYHTFLLTTPGGGNDELVISMANKVYKVPVILLTSFTVLEYLNVLAAGIGGVNILHAKDVSGEAVTGLTRLSRVACGGEVYQVRKYLDDGYQALHTNILNLVYSGLNIYDLEPGSTALSRIQDITSEVAALNDMLASVSKITDPTPITHIAQYLISQMFSLSITVSGGVVHADYSSSNAAWDAGPYAAHVDPAILLLCAEDEWYRSQPGARTSGLRFMADPTITAVVITMSGHQVARYDRQDGDASVADIYRRVIEEQSSDQTVISMTTGTGDLTSILNTLDVNCFYPVDIPTVEQGADDSLIGRGQQAHDPWKDTMLRYDSNSVILLPETGRRRDIYPQLAANHLAIEGMAFAHAEGEDDRETLAAAGNPLTTSAVYSGWKVSIRDTDDRTSEAFYVVTPNRSPSNGLDRTFATSPLFHAILEACANEILTKDHLGSVERPAVIMGSCCAHDASGCLQLVLDGGRKLTLRPSSCNVFLKYGDSALEHAPEGVPAGFSPLPVSGTDETENHHSPIYANVDEFIVDLVLSDEDDGVVTEGSFNLKSWPRLAIDDVRTYQQLLNNQIKTASSDQAAGGAKVEEGSQIPRNWLEDMFSWFKDLLDSKWLWIVIAIVVVIILSRNSGGSGPSTTVLLTSGAIPSADRDTLASAENTQQRQQSTQNDTQSSLDLI